MARLPGLIDRATRRWGLSLGTPFSVGTAAWTTPGVMADGTPVVLKLTFPHDEAKYEATALALWQGHAAVELLDHDTQDWALLLRRAHPGTLLLADISPPHVRLGIAVEILRNLHRAVASGTEMPSLTTVSAAWSHIATQRANRWAHLYEAYREEVTYGLGLLAAFGRPGAKPGPLVVLHGDLNPGNILLDAPGSVPPQWLAIDPKPMIGDPGYDLWPVLSQIDNPFLYPDPLAVLRPRVELAARALGIPFRRICEWACARSVESVLWQLETWPDPARQALALKDLTQVRCWAMLARS
ncbi:aminoglycoside phosphotransferase family protein [Occultella kanbiaonis]|uniref:aminoglycoside phosphotransferase family protein n=1 Tax=Occultella kanbiaonis TaxID=2675754 RepID=UPI0012B8FCCA|nr:aminoglycoside phosphotransferase family protein [Occultella kanbiaonis]